MYHVIQRWPLLLRSLRVLCLSVANILKKIKAYSGLSIATIILIRADKFKGVRVRRAKPFITFKNIVKRIDDIEW